MGLPRVHGVTNETEPAECLRDRLIGDSERLGDFEVAHAQTRQTQGVGSNTLVGRRGACVDDCNLEGDKRGSSNSLRSGPFF